MSELKIDCIIGIDPGAMGGIAINVAGKNVIVAKNPKDVRDLMDILSYYADTYHPIIFLEKLQVRPDDIKVDESGANLGKMYRIQRMLANFEHLKASIEMSGIPYCLVHPLSWQSKLGLRTKGVHEEKSERKKRYKEIAGKLYPEVKTTLWNADALLILEFGKRMLVDETGRKWILSNLPKREHSKLF